MIPDNPFELQLEPLRLRIAQEAGYSSDRIFLSDILTKMGVINNLIHALGLSCDAIEKDVQKLWKVKWRGLEKLKCFDKFRCSIKGMAANLAEYWPSANHAIASVKKSLRWLESLGIFKLNDVIEQPICTTNSKAKDGIEYKSPDKLFLEFNVDLALETYQALEQLCFQHSQDSVRTKRRRKTIEIENGRKRQISQTMPDHAGMLVRLIYSLVRGRKYRAFSKLPEGLFDWGYNKLSQERAIAEAIAEAAEIDRQIAENSMFSNPSYTRRVGELEKLRQKAEKAIAAIGREMAFAELPY